MTRRPNTLVVAAILIPVAAAPWAALIGFCWFIADATNTIIDIISRSL